jgi:Lar family restriction alleviation protein
MKLKECAYCGRDDLLDKFSCCVDIEGVEIDGYTVHCSACGVRGPCKNTERKAANAWNKRALTFGEKLIDRAKTLQEFYKE